MQIYQAAHKALLDLGKPAHVRVIHEQIVSMGYFQFGAKDPLRALGVAIDRHARGIDISKAVEPKLFYRAAPASYGLLEWLDKTQQADLDLDESVSSEETPAELDTSLFLEQELHLWLYKNLEKNGLETFGYGQLELYDTDSQANSIGKYNTGVVGEMDMLLVTESGDFVIVELKRESSDKTVGQICRYYGWVKENIAKDSNKVYGVVLAQEINEHLRYAIKATNSNISYRQLTLKVQLGQAIR